MVISYSLKKEGEVKLSKNFKVSEFACPDNTDKILIDTVLVDHLQAIRDYFGKPVDIGSGYRTKTYNTRIGGNPFSAHMSGEAGDIDVGRNAQAVPARTVAMFAQAHGIKRIGLYLYTDGRSWVHIGSGRTKSFWVDSAPGSSVAQATFLPVLKHQILRFTNKYEVAVAQEILKAKGFYTGPIDGRYGPGKGFKNAVLSFQKAVKINSDASIGPITWGKLFTI